MTLYGGLPVSLGIKIPASLKPTYEVKMVAEDPNHQGQAFPGGAVIDEIQIDLGAQTHDWIWLETRSK